MPLPVSLTDQLPDGHFRTLAETASDVIITIDAASRIHYVNPAVEALLGYRPEELLGQSLTVLMPERMRQRHLHAVRRYLRTGQRHIPWDGMDFTARHKSGSEVEVEVEVSLTTVQLEGRRYFMGIVRDARGRTQGTRWLATHRWLACQFAVTSAIADSVTLADGGPRLLQALCRALDWDLGELWLMDASGDRLACVGTWHSGLPQLVGYVEATRHRTFARGSGFPGRVWARGEPGLARDVAQDPAFRGHEAAVKAGIRSAVGAPVRHARQVIGVLVFASLDEITPEPGMRELLDHLGRVGGEFVARVRAEEELRHREQRFRSLIEYSDDAILLLDRTGRVGYASKPSERLLGYAPETLLRRPAAALVHPDDRDYVQEVLRECLAQPGKAVRVECRCRHKDRSWHVIEAVAVNRLQDPAVGAVVVNYRDVTERKRAEAALRESEQRYALATRAARDGLWDWDLQRNTIYLSARWKGMLGYAESEINQDPDEWFSRLHPDDRAMLRAAINDHLSGRWPHLEAEYRIRHKDGNHRWMLCRGLAIRGRDGTPVRMAGSQTDITERKLAEGRLLDAATRDALTSLPNRPWLEALLQRAVERARARPDDRFAVLFLDLDRFKVINDSLGHAVGDQLLIAVARRLERCMRPGDMVARLGGDEFAVLLYGVRDTGDATQVAERILEVLRAPFEILGHEVFTGVSIGIADSATGYRQARDILRDADLAMYRAKATGPAQYRVFDAALHARAVTLLETETGLRRAVERNEFVLHFQPIVSLIGPRLVGVEALVRWRDPERGLRLPAEFIGVAEETGLIVPIGEWVLREACQQMQRWRERFGREPAFTVSVNVSGKQLRQPDFEQRVAGVLTEVGLEPRHLRLEITENAILDDPETTGRTLAQLRTLGIAVALDDFGTGYASLTHLYRLPIASLKIDRSFVSTVHVSEQNRAIIAAIASLARTLGIALIAEGIETVEQLSALRALECRLGQGYFFCHPTEAGAVEPLLERLMAAG